MQLPTRATNGSLRAGALATCAVLGSWTLVPLRGGAAELSAEQRAVLDHVSLVRLPDGRGGFTEAIRFSGVNVQIVNGLEATNGNPADPTSLDDVRTNGLGNLILGYNEPSLPADSRTGSHNVVIGTGHAYTSFGGVVFGRDNVIEAPFASVTAGRNNHALAALSSIGGGSSNVTSAMETSVTGGQGNTAAVLASWVGGGLGNYSGGYASSVSGGLDNRTESDFASVSGGAGNLADGPYSAVSGGQQNAASDEGATVSGGEGNLAGARNATVSGGCGNAATTTCAHVP